jgi:hypothetical protein
MRVYRKVKLHAFQTSTRDGGQLHGPADFTLEKLDGRMVGTRASLDVVLKRYISIPVRNWIPGIQTAATRSLVTELSRLTDKFNTLTYFIMYEISSENCD